MSIKIHKKEGDTCAKDSKQAGQGGRSSQRAGRLLLLPLPAQIYQTARQFSSLTVAHLCVKQPLPSHLPPLPRRAVRPLQRRTRQRGGGNPAHLHEV